MKDIQRYMLVLAIFGNLYLYIQAYSIASTQITAGISELAFVITLISSSIWFFYGISMKDPVIKTSATFGVIGSILILVLLFQNRGVEPDPIIKFDKHNRNPMDIIKAYHHKLDESPWLFVENDDTDVIVLPYMYINDDCY